MRDQKVWSLLKLERLHISGWGMNVLQTALLHVSGHTQS